MSSEVETSLDLASGRQTKDENQRFLDCGRNDIRLITFRAESPRDRGTPA